MYRLGVERQTRTLTIDLSAKTVTFEGYGRTSTDMMMKEHVWFATKDPSRPREGVLLGDINRISGAVFVRAGTLSDGLHIFEGNCKPTQKF
jgi:hypothetical protein